MAAGCIGMLLHSRSHAVFGWVHKLPAVAGHNTGRVAGMGAVA
jgi:hypothetical protein